MSEKLLNPPTEYVLYSRGNTKNTYVLNLPHDQGCIYLDININGTAELSAVVRNVTLSSGFFSYPHRLFDVFESDLILAYIGAKNNMD